MAAMQTLFFIRLRNGHVLVPVKLYKRKKEITRAVEDLTRMFGAPVRPVSSRVSSESHAGPEEASSEQEPTVSSV